PTTAAQGKSPRETLFARRPDVSRFRPFGCLAYMLIDKTLRTWKFGDRARKCVMLGYNTG
ncbi:hypothetical protein EXIGLDRAFT_576900, partial [Exidia glandulosa HHB12029]